MGTYGYAAPEYVMTGMAYIVYASFSYVNYGSFVMTRITFSPNLLEFCKLEMNLIPKICTTMSCKLFK